MQIGQNSGPTSIDWFYAKKNFAAEKNFCIELNLKKKKLFKVKSGQGQKM
jgi:hypothetical protein